MIMDYDEDAHFCIKCHVTMLGLENYINHRKMGCSKNLTEYPKSPLPNQLLPTDETFNLKADDFFSSLELRSSSKISERQLTSGKNFSGILTRSKTTAVIQASSNVVKEQQEPQQSKSGKNVWIGGHQLKELGHGDNQSKLIKAVDNLERRKEEPQKLELFEDSEEDSEEFDYDVDDSSSDDQDRPPRNHTGGKWKPSSPIQWSRNIEVRDSNSPPPTFTGGKWKPKRSSSPPVNYTKGKWKPPIMQKDYYNVAPSTCTGSKWVSKKAEELDVPPPTFSGSKWMVSKKQVHEIAPPTYTKGKWKQKGEADHLLIDIEDQESKSTAVKETKTKTEENYTKEKWISPAEVQNKFPKKVTDISLLTKSSGSVQYWCNPCNRRLASKLVYERHLKSELHFKRTSRDRQLNETDELSFMKEIRRTKLKPPEPIFSSQEQSKKSLQQIKKNQNHFTYKKEDITSKIAKDMELGSIKDMALESPYQCSLCKFYCNTLDQILGHWLTLEHINKSMQGYFYCNICKHRADRTDTMYKHLLSPEHAEATTVNRPIPIVIKHFILSICPTCNKEFLLNIQLINHCKQLQHDDSKVKKFKNEYVCDICGVGFLSSKSLRRHKHVIHKEKYFICTPCNLKFTDINEAKLHRKSQQHKYTSLEKQNRANLKKKCQYCEEYFGNFLLLKRHLNSEHPEHNVRCPHCGATFTITQELTTHLRLKQCKFQEPSETIENTLQCEKCPYSSNSISELFFHIALHEEPLVSYQNHTASSLVKAVLKYKCPVCENFYPKASLQGHIRQHTQDRPFICKICGKSFARKNNLQFHVKNHQKRDGKVQLKQIAEEKSFLCCTCGANFKKKSILQQHMQTHTGKLCKCPHTDCIFTARKMSEINEHCKIHSNAKNFACNICDYKGKTKSLLAKHKTVHKDLKKYRCKHCSFTTRNPQHLRRHVRIHTGAKPFSCPHCNYKCSNLENLRKHVISTNKHVGKFLYECRFCSGDKYFQSNFAKDFKVHLVTEHPLMFNNRTEATSFVAGIYDVHDDIIGSFINAEPEQKNIDELDSKENGNNDLSKLNSDDDPIVCQSDNNVTSGKDHIMQRLIIPKYDCGTVENISDSWSLVGKYDVEENSGTLVPFESDSETLFQEHF